MKETLWSSFKFFIKAVMVLVALGWTTYEHAESFVNERIEKAVLEVKSIREQDMDNINRRFDKLEQQGNIVINHLINKGK